MEKPTLLVLAAGMGSRYGGLKQIDPMGPAGETILDYSIYDAIRGGFAKVVFVIRKEFEESFRDSVGNRFMDRIAVDYAFQELEDIPVGFEVPGERRKPWGTAHAVYSARNEMVAMPMFRRPIFYLAQGPPYQGHIASWVIVWGTLSQTMVE